MSSDSGQDDTTMPRSEVELINVSIVFVFNDAADTDLNQDRFLETARTCFQENHDISIDPEDEPREPGQRIVKISGTVLYQSTADNLLPKIAKRLRRDFSISGDSSVEIEDTNPSETSRRFVYTFGKELTANFT